MQFYRQSFYFIQLHYELFTFPLAFSEFPPETLATFSYLLLSFRYDGDSGMNEKVEEKKMELLKTFNQETLIYDEILRF